MRGPLPSAQLLYAGLGGIRSYVSYVCAGRDQFSNGLERDLPTPASAGREGIAML